MNRLGGLPLFSRAYPALALVVAAVLLSPAYLAVSLPILALYIYLELRWDGSRATILMALFLAFSLPLLFKPVVGAWFSVLLALPVVALLDSNLRRYALRQEFSPGVKGHRPTRLCLSLALCLMAVGFVAWALGSWNLLASCAVVAGYVGGVAGWGLREASRMPIRADVMTHKAVAGQPATAAVKLRKLSRMSGQLRLSSPHPWLSIRPSWFVADGQSAEIELSFTPPFSGPTALASRVAFMDSWGLVQTDFELTVAEVFVIPRARYAEWLARRYLKMSRSGSRETMTSAAAAQRTTKRGVEFYGVRTYQPGDSAKTIDWKHTLKLHQMVVREFLDSGVESAILLVNLCVSDEEDGDKLAYSLIMTALTLSRESIPSVVAAYDHRGVVLNSRLLDPSQALLQALSLTKQIRISLSPQRYLQAPDVARLRANIHRLNESKRSAGVRLAELLQLEYAALGKAAQSNPATQALTAALSVGRARANVLIVSRHNHDAEALAFARHSLTERGYRVMTPEAGKRGVN
ncbi:MAG: DUF58 domain-containing protein [Dehalococcoidia bacterium]|nr:DUF58 domain-containing protein [Dehalococcoidia bacterium]